MPADGKAVVYNRIGTPDPVAFITVDDGYGGPYTDAVNYAATAQLPITAFLTYYAVNTHASDFLSFGSLLKVGSHAKNHIKLPLETDDEQLRQILLSKQWLTGLFNTPINLFRPPYGLYNDVTRAKSYQAGFPLIVTWTHSVTNGVIKGGEVTNGSIFLMHFDPELAINLEVTVNAITDAGLSVAPLENYVL